MSTSIVIMAILFVAPLLVVVIFGISLLVRPPFNWLSSQENPINKMLTGVELIGHAGRRWSGCACALCP